MVLLIGALICFIADAVSHRIPGIGIGDTRLAAVGLALWVLSLLL